MTLLERAANYSRTFPNFPPLRADDRWLDGVWILGNDYRGSGYYGAYPPSYLRRVRALFPDVGDKSLLHLFSGSLPPAVGGIRLDRARETQPDVLADAARLPFRDSFGLVLADPPYSRIHAAKYAARMINRRVVLHEIAQVTCAGGHLVWLDTQVPMFAKTDWHWYGAIAVIRSTNHAIRLCSLFERR